MAKYVCADCSEPAVAESPTKLYCATCALKAIAKGAKNIRVGLTPIKINFAALQEAKKIPGKATEFLTSMKNKVSESKATDTILEQLKIAASLTSQIKNIFKDKNSEDKTIEVKPTDDLDKSE